MAKRRTRFEEDDLKIIFEQYMKPTWMDEDAHIVGFEFKTKTIKRGGDYYKDGVNDKDYPKDGVETIRWIKVLTESGRKRRDDASDDGDGGDDEAGTDVPGEGTA